MKRTRKFSGIIIGIMMMFVLATGTTAYGLNYNFEDKIEYWEIGCLQFDSIEIIEGHPLAYTHDINQEVNFPRGDRVIQASLELDFTNDLLDTHILYDFREYVRVGFDGVAWQNIGEVDAGQYALVLNIDWLNDNGLLDVAIQVSNPGWNLASAWLDHSRLYGVAEYGAVPEPGSLILLGLGLIGVVTLGRRKLWK